MASAAKGGGTKMTEALALVAATLGDGVEYGHALELLAALAGGGPTHNLGAVVDHLFCVEGTLSARDGLDEEPGIFID